ncbi:MAG: hypothetical protein NW215_02275 [Hyphomicrobiales bacterium]|nr:hypothetical protein [Hyphomicrobiales bacterium]
MTDQSIKPAGALGMTSVSSQLLRPPEKLVAVGFRCWLSGYQRGAIQSWETCWSYYRRELGAEAARKAVTDLASWVNMVRLHALRDIELMPPQCPSFCRDECLAVSLIAASQHDACPALQACAYALMGADDIEPVLKTAADFARTLEGANVRLGRDLVAARDAPAASSVH